MAQRLCFLAAVGMLLMTATEAVADEPGPDEVQTSAISSESMSRRMLPRYGGHSRVGFDDISIPSPVDLPYREIVDPARYVPGSLSVGTTSDGYLIGSAHLPDESRYHYVLEGHRERDTHYGTEEIVELLLHAGEYTRERHSGSRIAVGNMASMEGGDIRWSHSHNNGRDADVAFFLRDEDGRPVTREGLVEIRSTGVARRDRDVYFDVERNWTFIEGLLSHPETDVQWVFVYRPLKRMLLEHAREIGADPEIIEIASRVLHQPGDSSPHDDHFHIRVYCSLQDRLEGCSNWGPEWDHADLFEDEVEVRVRELIRGLMDPQPAVASGCIEFLKRLAPRSNAMMLTTALPHQTPSVQIELMDLIGRLDQRGTAGPAIALAESAPDDDVRRKAFWLLGRLADPGTAEGLVGIMRRDRTPLADGTPARQAAAVALRNIIAPEIIPALIEVLDDPRPEVRAAVAHVLERNAVRPSLHDAGAELTDEAHAELLDDWNRWFVVEGDWPRYEWIELAFEAAGYEVGSVSENPSERGFINALEDERDYIRFNADRQLMHATGHWTPSEGWSIDRRSTWWQRKLGIRRDRSRR